MNVVLIIEDNGDVAEYLKVSLQMEGCEAHVSETRDDAIAFMIRHGLPDIIIMDWHMPGMGVEEFLYKLAQLNPRLPRLILMTAGENADDAARKYNIPEVLRKPFTADQVLHQVDGCK